MSFGPKVIGDEAFAIQQKKEKGGSAFGPRVRDDLPGVPPKQASAAQAPGAATQHGARIEKTEDSGLSVGQFVKILDDNTAFLDTLYVQELGRVDGPRRECLLKARQVAIKLANRQDIVKEVDELLADMTAQAPASAPSATPAASTANTENTLTEAERAKAEKEAKIAHVTKLDDFDDLKAIAADLGLDKPKSKAAAKKAILAKLAE